MNRPAALLSFAALAVAPDAQAQPPAAMITQNSPICIHPDGVVEIDGNSYLVAQHVQKALAKGIRDQQLFLGGEYPFLDLGLEDMSVDGLKPSDYKNFTCVPVGIRVMKTTEIHDGLKEAEFQMCLPDMMGGWETDQDCENLTLRYGRTIEGTAHKRYQPTRDETAGVLSAARVSLDDFREDHGLTAMPASITAWVHFSRQFDRRAVHVPFGGVHGRYKCDPIARHRLDWKTVGDLTVPVGLYHNPRFSCSPRSQNDRVGEVHRDFVVEVPVVGPMSYEHFTDAAMGAIQRELGVQSREFDWFDQAGNPVSSPVEKKEIENAEGVQVNSTFVLPEWLSASSEVFLKQVSTSIQTGLGEKGYKLKNPNAISEDAFGAFTDLSRLQNFEEKISGEITYVDQDGFTQKREIKNFDQEQLMTLVADIWVRIIRNTLFQRKPFGSASVSFDVKNCQIKAEIGGMVVGFEPDINACADGPGLSYDSKIGTFTISLSE